MVRKVTFLETECVIETARYSNGRLAIELIDTEDGMPFTTATINIPEEPLGDDEVIIKTYSENEGLEQVLVQADIITEKVRYVSSGFISAPVYKVNPDLLS